MRRLHGCGGQGACRDQAGTLPGVSSVTTNLEWRAAVRENMEPVVSDRWTIGRVLGAAATVAGLVLFLMLLWKAAFVFLLLFVAILLAILLQGLAEWSAAVVPAPYWVRLTAVLTVIVVVCTAAIYLRAPAVGEQVGTLRMELPEAADRIQASLTQHSLGRQLLGIFPDSDMLISEVGNRASTVFSMTLSAFGYFLFVLFTLLLIAYQPGLYRRGIELLVPPARRSHASKVLDEIWETLWWWLAARGAAMLFVGISVTVGLTVLDIPLALTLGLIAALLDFVPNFGPIVAAIPAVLLAAVKGPSEALMVAGLYFVVQLLEGNVVTPIAQKHAID
ncbi:MAG TPA: AI-2E family transporter, partial [Bryobacteraceae bacterium]|nr:AI-2E family transporter [Bryobacteraceae bacterium]